MGYRSSRRASPARRASRRCAAEAGSTPPPSAAAASRACSAWARSPACSSSSASRSASSSAASRSASGAHRPVGERSTSGSRPSVRGAGCGEVGGEVSAGDLARRPPQCARGDVPAQRAGRAALPDGLLAAQLGPQVQRRAAGQEQPAQDRAERRRHPRAEEIGEERRGDGVGLLGGEAALLDRERGGVACRVPGAGAGDAPVAVDGNEAVLVYRQALDPRSLHRWQHHRLVRRDRRAVVELELPPCTPVARPRTNEIRRRFSSSETASEADGPNKCIGAGSGVTSVRETASAPGRRGRSRS